MRHCRDPVECHRAASNRINPRAQTCFELGWARGGTRLLLQHGDERRCCRLCCGDQSAGCEFLQRGVKLFNRGDTPQSRPGFGGIKTGVGIVNAAGVLKVLGEVSRERVDRGIYWIAF